MLQHQPASSLTQSSSVHGAPRRGRRRRRRGCCGSLPGAPSARVCALVEHVDAVADAYMISAPCCDRSGARAQRDRRARRGRSPRTPAPRPPADPAAGSSAEHEGGLHRERARDAGGGARRRAPARRQARWTRGAVRPSSGEQRIGASDAPRAGLAPTPSAATSTFSRTAERRGRTWSAGTCARGRRAPAYCGAPRRVISAPSSSIAPAVGKSNPVAGFTSVDLPAPFGPIRPTTSWRCSSSVTSSKRLHALERARDAPARAECALRRRAVGMLRQGVARSPCRFRGGPELPGATADLVPRTQTFGTGLGDDPGPTTLAFLVPVMLRSRGTCRPKTVCWVAEKLLHEPRESSAAWPELHHLRSQGSNRSSCCPRGR